jgi:hypothetical protein
MFSFYVVFIGVERNKAETAQKFGVAQVELW